MCGVLPGFMGRTPLDTDFEDGFADDLHGHWKFDRVGVVVVVDCVACAGNVMVVGKRSKLESHASTTVCSSVGLWLTRRTR